MNRAITLLLLLQFVVPVLWAASTPTTQVRELVDSVLVILNRPDLDYTAKRNEISGLVQEHIDIPSISKRTLGKYWRKATPAQRERFASLFIRVLEATYLNRIKDYSGGRVDYLRERIKEVKAIVDAQFVTDKLKVPIQYKMLLIKDNWQIYDVVIENVSLVRNYRSSYGEIIGREGFDGLFARLENKLAEDARTDQVQ